MNRKSVVNIGIQRFDILRKQGSFYVDKTDFYKGMVGDWFGDASGYAS